ncbi:MAG: hypothetical protein DLM58_14035 [Pseudonocardiales bacterium]|nr:MAG: hypothetical protein DLM58_14035 [Pseudonocardiales bacterium]
MTVSAEAAFQAQAGRELRTHSEGIVSAMTRLRQLTGNLQSGLRGDTLSASLAAHDAQHALVIKSANRLAGHGDHFVTSSGVNSANDQDASGLMAQFSSGSIGSIVNK